MGDGVWNSSFWSEGSLNPLNLKIVVPRLCPQGPRMTIPLIPIRIASTSDF